MRSGGRRTIRLAALLAGGVLLLLVLAQVLLPRLAASRVSSKVGRYGTVNSVSVSAWPAVKLLWGDADSVRVNADSISLSPAQVSKLLWEARGTSRMDITAQSVTIGSLRLTGASLHKRGSALTAVAHTTEADVKAALPAGFSVRLLRSEHGEVEVSATGGLFGVDASVNAVAGASAGRLVAHPLGFLLEGVQLTLFSDPHIYVEGVGASVAGEQPRSYLLTMSALLH
jgi:LmeA-like phospholipid-binding